MLLPSSGTFVDMYQRFVLTYCRYLQENRDLGSFTILGVGGGRQPRSKPQLTEVTS